MRGGSHVEYYENNWCLILFKIWSGMQVSVYWDRWSLDVTVTRQIDNSWGISFPTASAGSCWPSGQRSPLTDGVLQIARLIHSFGCLTSPPLYDAHSGPYSGRTLASRFPHYCLNAH